MKNVRTFVRMFCALFLCFFVFNAYAGEYVVVKGDSLSRVAVKYKVGGNWKGLWAINPQIKNPDMILIGQKLNVPDAAPTPVAARKEEQVIPVPLNSMQKELKADVSIAAQAPIAAPADEVKAVSKAVPAILARASVPDDTLVAEPVAQATETKIAVREEQLPPAQAPPEDVMTKTSSSTAKAVVTSAVKTDVHVTVVPSNPSVPATAPAVDDFNGQNIIPVGATPSNQPAVQEKPVVQSAPAAAVAQTTKVIPKAKKFNDDDFDSPAWDSRAIDMNGRIIDTQKKPVQSAAVAVPVQVLQAQ